MRWSCLRSVLRCCVFSSRGRTQLFLSHLNKSTAVGKSLQTVINVLWQFTILVKMYKSNLKVSNVRLNYSLVIKVLKRILSEAHPLFIAWGFNLNGKVWLWSDLFLLKILRLFCNYISSKWSDQMTDKYMHVHSTVSCLAISFITLDIF